MKKLTKTIRFILIAIALIFALWVFFFKQDNLTLRWISAIFLILVGVIILFYDKKGKL